MQQRSACVNVVAAEQHLAIRATGNIYKQGFQQRGIAPQCLSRQIEDTATVTSVLVPWNSCGAYAAGVLNVATIAYLPFAFFNWINPLVSFFYDLMGWQIHRVPVQTEFPAPPTDVQFYGVDGHAAVEFPADGGLYLVVAGVHGRTLGVSGALGGDLFGLHPRLRPGPRRLSSLSSTSSGTSLSAMPAVSDEAPYSVIDCRKSTNRIPTSVRPAPRIAAWPR